MSKRHDTGALWPGRPVAAESELLKLTLSQFICVRACFCALVVKFSSLETQIIRSARTELFRVCLCAPIKSLTMIAHCQHGTSHTHTHTLTHYEVSLLDDDEEQDFERPIRRRRRAQIKIHKHLRRASERARVYNGISSKWRFVDFVLYCTREPKRQMKF